MKIIFMGSPEAVIAPLKYLIENAKDHGHEVIGVISQPAKPVGRKKQLTDPPVAAFAKEAGILCLQPAKASSEDFLVDFKALDPDIVITAAYGQILSDKFLAIPNRATINIHPSDLPKYRGATPVPACLLDGLKETAISVLFTVKKLDAGNIILQQNKKIQKYETAGELTHRLFLESSALQFDALKMLENLDFVGTPQDESLMTFCKKIDKADGQVDWNKSSQTILNRFLAYEPWPGTYTFLNGKRINLSQIEANDDTHSLKAGEVLFDKPDKSLIVGTGSGNLKILKLKPAGGKVVDAPSFWNGIKDKNNVTFADC